MTRDYYTYCPHGTHNPMGCGSCGPQRKVRFERERLKDALEHILSIIKDGYDLRPIVDGVEAVAKEALDEELSERNRKTTEDFQRETGIFD